LTVRFYRHLVRRARDRMRVDFRSAKVLIDLDFITEAADSQRPRNAAVPSVFLPSRLQSGVT
jgi:hypothetical protein